MSSVHPKTPRHFDTLGQASQDIKVIQCLVDESLRVARAAEVNIDTLAAMSRLAARLASGRKSGANDATDLGDFVERIDEVRFNHVAHVRTEKSLASQTKSILDQVWENPVATRITHPL